MDTPLPQHPFYLSCVLNWTFFRKTLGVKCPYVFIPETRNTGVNLCSMGFKQMDKKYFLGVFKFYLTLALLLYNTWDVHRIA